MTGEKEENIFVHELILQQRNIPPDQIDYLLKSKKKYLTILQ